jgi:DNA invertase Pin-like site-specific DNA recombinase
MKKLIGYVRISRVGTRDKEMLRSPEQQQRAIEAYAANNPSDERYEIVWLEPDLDESGKDLNRPSMQEALRMIRAGEADGLIAARLDRITRSVSDLDYLMKASQKEGWLLIGIDMGLDPTSANGQLIWGVMGNINEWYLNRSRETWTEARTDALDHRVHVGSRAPFGYRKVPHVKDADGKVTERRGWLEPDPVTGPVVTEIYQRRAAGEGWPTIRNWLNANGYVTTLGNPWNMRVLNLLVRNRTYLGELNDKGLGKRIPGAHPPLTDPSTFAAVQDRRGVRSVGKPGANALLRGIARCAGCRYLLGPIRIGRESAEFQYKCRSSAGDGACPAPTQIAGGDALPGTHGQRLEEYVEEKAREKMAAKKVALLSYGSTSRLAELEAAAKAAKEQRNAFANDLEAQEAFGDEGTLIRAAAFDARVEAAEAALEEERRVSGGQESMLHALEIYDSLSSVDKKREALATLIQAVFVRQGNGQGASDARVHIVWRDDPAVDLPRQGRRGFVRRPFVFPEDDGDPNTIGVHLPG